MNATCDLSAGDLAKKKCVPCEGGIPALTIAETQRFLEAVEGWALAGDRIEKDYEFGNFVEALRFVNAVGQVAEAEGHHPDLNLHSYRKLRITLYTHAVSGLTENDFIVASKIDALKR